MKRNKRKQRIVEWQKNKVLQENGGVFVVLSEFFGSFLLIASTLIMMAEAIEDYSVGRDVYIQLAVMIFLIVVWNDGFGRKYRHDIAKIYWGGNIVIAVLVYFYERYRYREELVDIISGKQAFWSRFFEQWNYYFKANVKVDNGDVTNISIYIVVMAIVITLILQFIRSVLKFRWVQCAFGIFIFVGILFIGLVPKWLGIATLFVGEIISIADLRWNKDHYKENICVLVVIMCMISIVSYLFEKPAVTIADQKENMQEFQDELEARIAQYAGFGEDAYSTGTDGNIANSTPEYKEKEVIHIIADKKPYDNLYLRGFYGDVYEGYDWSKDDEDFQKVCEQYHQDENIVARELFAMTENIDLDYNDNFIPRINYEIDYSGIRSVEAYLPYGVSIKNLMNSEKIKVDSDYHVRKNIGKKSISFVGLPFQEYMLQKAYAYNNSIYTPGSYASDSESVQLCDWYNSYAIRRYTNDSTDIKVIDNIASIINMQYRQWGYADTYTSNTVYHKNIKRCLMADLVRKELRSRCKYDLQLDKIDDNTDPIEYFLEQSHKGYCVHFASAATLLLQRLGVPARYVTGYVVKGNRWKEKEGKYVAQVLDSSAHAWVEIYLDNYGWMPVDVTPGYSGDINWREGSELDTSWESTQNDSYEEPVDMDDYTEEIAGVDEEIQEQEEISEQEILREEIDAQPNEEESLNEYEDSAADNSDTLKEVKEEGNVNVRNEKWQLKESLNVIKIILIVSLAIIFIAAVVIVHIRRNSNSGKIKRLENKKDYDRALLLINQELYNKLCSSKNVFKRHWTDNDLWNAMIRQGIDEKELEGYKNCVRKMAYSNEKLTEEEYEYCVAIYNELAKKRSK